MSTPSSSPSPPALNVDGTFGALFIGYSLSTLIYGCTMVQTYYYVVSKRTITDSVWLKLLTCMLFVLDTASHVFATGGIYRFLISDFGNPLALAKTDPNSGGAWEGYYAFASASSLFIVELFYVWRFWSFGANVLGRWRWVVCGLTLPLSLLNFGSYLAVGVTTFKPTSVLQQRTTNATPPWKIAAPSGAACDLIISVSMVACLLWSRDKRGMKRTNFVVNYLIIFIVNAGLITTLLSIASLVTVLARPDTLIYAAISLILPKSYVASFLAILNSREFLREKISENNTAGLSTISLPRFTQSTGQSSDTPIYDSTKKAPETVDNVLDINSNPHSEGPIVV